MVDHHMFYETKRYYGISTSRLGEPVNQEQAETLALEALQFIVSDDAIMSALSAQTGMGPEDLRQSASDPVVLGALLDFLLDDERRTVSFCEAFGIDPELPGRARLALPGATAGIWE
jgi:uncharacterized protein DUF3572